MQDIPDLDDLLETARESVLEKILPLIPPDERLETLMVANALGIVRRAVAAGDKPLRRELESLSVIYDCPAPPGLIGEELVAAVKALNVRLAADIRRGAFDGAGEKRRAVEAFLRESTTQNLRESNPKMLKAEGID